MKPFVPLVCFFGILLAGCGQKPAAPVIQAEYTNSIAGELETQRLLADWAYTYGHAQAVIEAQREKFGSDFEKGAVPEHSQEDMERQAADIFWYQRTNATARARVNSGR